MKLTTKLLKKLIREELSNLNEDTYDWSPEHGAIERVGANEEPEEKIDPCAELQKKYNSEMFQASTSEHYEADQSIPELTKQKAKKLECPWAMDLEPYK